MPTIDLDGCTSKETAQFLAQALEAHFYATVTEKCEKAKGYAEDIYNDDDFCNLWNPVNESLCELRFKIEDANRTLFGERSNIFVVLQRFQNVAMASLKAEFKAALTRRQIDFSTWMNLGR